jgi:putative hydrolase of HD superfamily
MNFERWERQLRFSIKADELKIYHESREENYAERSWHLSLMALLLSEYANDNTDLDVFRVLKMLIVRDLIEVGRNSSNTSISDNAPESDIINHFFTILPEDQHLELYLYWKEYEETKTPEARYAKLISSVKELLQSGPGLGIEKKLKIIKIIQNNEIEFSRTSQISQ